jgi:hypothetical protein
VTAKTRSALLLAVLALVLTACPPDPPVIVYEMDGVSGHDTLTMRLKRYNDDGTVDLFDAEPVALRAGTERLSLQVALPSPGRWAVHLVAVGGPRPASETRCHVVAEGAVADSGVHLSVLSPAVDADGDTFPDDYRLYCAERTALGLPCANVCDGPEWLALLDCDPADDLELPPGCPAVAPPDARWNPFASDLCADCFDQDCYGGDPPCEDGDEDGYRADIDCDDNNPAVNPGSAEGCGRDDPSVCPGCGDLTDNDCDGVIDEGCFGDDFDMDGAPAASDCNDCDPGIGPGFVEICGNGVDEDCSEPEDATLGDLPCDETDLDGDGFAFPADADCDDTDPRTYPGAPDRCGDGALQNCVTDRACATDDTDGDLFVRGADCNDADASVNPWAAEICDALGVDEDCDGRVNEVHDPARRFGCGRNAGTGQWGPVDFQTDLDHCGACRRRCAGTTWSTGDRCVAGECRCGEAEPCEGSPDQWCCPASGCVDLATDEANCGACGAWCQPGEECRPTEIGRPGACACPHEEDERACPAGECWRCCPGRGCVNVCEDLHACGECGVDCTGGERPLGDTCVAGVCLCGLEGVQCVGSTLCSWVVDPDAGCGCEDLLGDPLNCGECGNQCVEGEACVEGVCACGGAAGCPEGTTCCTTACADLTNDEAHCGRCGTACNPGEECTGGECRCTEGCEDGDPCTTGSCTAGNRCVQRTKDADGDNYCDAECPDAATGAARDCAFGDGDCDDDDPTVRPGVAEMCNGVDDDCSATTPDGEDQCVAQHQVCAPGSEPACACEAGWETCSATCNCNVGDGRVCCAGICRLGDCCGDADCGGSAPRCVGNTCTCTGIVCDGTCHTVGVGTPCCGDGDCSHLSTAPHCNPATHLCTCDGVVCGARCVRGGNCCDDSECGAALCCDNVCRAVDCCTVADCPDEGSWICTASLECECAPGFVNCGGTCNCDTGPGGDICCPAPNYCSAPGTC